MKTITFRPLRRIKKMGKIAVASYSQWYGIQTANYSQFQLVLVDDYLQFASDEPVYNHEGERLFFPDYDPYQLPIYSNDGYYSLKKHYEENVAFCWRHVSTQYSPNEWIGFHGTGMDCTGTPTFSHLTISHIAESYSDISVFEPLTVGTVTNWLGWFLLRRENALITTRK